MSTTTVAVQTAEKFHLNEAHVSGRVTRLWTWNGSAFLQTDRRLTVRVPIRRLLQDGQAIEAGVFIRAQGYVVDTPWEETVARFLEKAGKRDLAKQLPAEFLHAVCKRVSTTVAATQIETVEQADDAAEDTATLEGLVVKTWAAGDTLNARLAVYDQHTPIISPDGGNRGRPRRKAHYATVQFGADVKPGALKKGEHLIVSGRLVAFGYGESLREFALKAGAAETLAQLDGVDVERLGEITIGRLSVKLVAQSLVRLTR